MARVINRNSDDKNFEKLDNINLETTLYASIPRISELCCVICQINIHEVYDSSAKSHYHWQTMKCRLIIYMMPEVIASPLYGSRGTICVITSNDFYETERMQSILSSINILITEKKPVTADIYKAALQCTILFKISPNWNKVGRFLLHGRDFLTHTEGSDGIIMDLLINDQELCVKVRATRIKKSPVMLEEICLPQNLLIEFMADPNGFIDLKPFGHPWVHVLPSMKRGMVVSVSKKIPETCPFKNYDELRRHWKNMHGYRLPQSEEGIVYYQIHFPIAQSNTFTYPNVCLANDYLKILRNGKPEIIADRFAQNFMKKITNVCGTRIWINRDRDFLNTKELFLTSDKNIGTLSESNPIWNCASTSSNAVESTVNLTFSDTCANELCRNISGLMSPTQSLRGSITQEAIDIFKTPCLTDANLNSKKIWINDKYSIHQKNESRSDTVNNNSFKGNKELYCQEVIPKYEWKSQKVNSVKKSEIYSQTTNHSQTASQCESELTKNHEIELNQPITNRILKQSQTDLSQNQMNNLNTIDSKQLITYFFKEQKSVQNPTSTSNKREFESFNMASRENRDDSQSQEQSQEMLLDNQNKKRKIEMSRNVSIEDLAKQNNLDQLTVAELKNWLKERCIPFKVQDRKSSLIRIIISHIKNTQLLTERLKL